MNTTHSSPSARPKHLDLLRIRFPVGAVLSLGHRASGLLLFLLTPLFIYLFARSLGGEEGFDGVVSLFASPLVRVVLFVALWALVHHLLAGLRFLVMDLGLGETRSRARQSAWLVFILEAVIMLAVLVALL